MKIFANSFFVSYMVTTITFNALMNLMDNAPNFDMNRFLVTTLLTTSFYFIGIVIKKIYRAFLAAYKDNIEYKKAHPGYEDPW